MKIELLTLNDFPKYRDEMAGQLNDLVRRDFPSDRISEDYGSMKCEDIRRHLEDGSAVIFLALEEGLLGWLWCHEIGRFEEKRLHIADIYIKEGSRGKGIGTGLMKEAEDYARNKNYSGIDLLVTNSNREAVSFYEKEGFSAERSFMTKRFEC